MNTMTIKATAVFVPGAYPQHTYVLRGEGLEEALRNAIDTPGQLVSLAGPSKSGKTVLVEKVVGRDLLISISGASLGSPDDVWNRILDWMDIPDSTSSNKTTSGTIGGGAAISGAAGLPIFAKAEVTGSANTALARESGSEMVSERHGLKQVVHEIGNSDYVVLIDDFHYMAREVQAEVAKALKEAIRLGVKVVTAAVSHRGDDVVRANPELRGRVRAIDLRYWDSDQLREIADRGFDVLNVKMPKTAIDKFANESAGSPQLMQSMCLQACFVSGLREKTPQAQIADVNADKLQHILEQTSASTDFRSLVDVLDSGPPTRGTERKTYDFKDNTRGDVYRCVLKAVAADPPKLSFPYNELLARTTMVCTSESPVGSSVTGTCLQLSKLAQDKFPNERAIDWDEQKQVLDIPDPYLLFYLRWSGRLREE
jgi:hypothetical protein